MYLFLGERRRNTTPLANTEQRQRIRGLTISRRIKSDPTDRRGSRGGSPGSSLGAKGREHRATGTPTKALKKSDQKIGGHGADVGRPRRRRRGRGGGGDGGADSMRPAKYSRRTKNIEQRW